MGCQQSSLVESHDHITAVGQTERLQSRAARIQQRQEKESTPENVPDSLKTSPKLNEKGHLMPEEVVRRTQCSILTQKHTLGTAEYPIQIEVRAQNRSYVGHQ